LHWNIVMTHLKYCTLVFVIATVSACSSGGGGGSNTTFFSTAPVISLISPSAGLAGASITITGVNFDPRQNVVTFNGNPATITANSATSLTVTVPSIPTGPVGVIVRAGVQESASATFTVQGQPTISNLSPASAMVGDTVVITGTNFDPLPANNAITVNGGAVTAVAGNTTTLTFTVPNLDATGSPYAVIAQVGNLSSNSQGLTITTTGPLPIVGGLSPMTANSGANIVVSGSNFSTKNGRTDLFNTVVFGNTAVAAQNGGTSNALTVTVPNLSAGNVAVTVITEGKASATSQILTIGQAAPSPQISSLNPTSGAVGSTVLINGMNFNSTPGNNSVNFGGTLITPSLASATQLTVTVPAALNPGIFAVTVTTGGQSSNSNNFTVVGPSPSITNLNPSSGPVGTSVVITGSNFSPVVSNNTVTIDGMTVTPSNVSATSLTVIIPTVPLGSRAIVVTVGGQSANTNFTVTQAPVMGAGLITGGGALSNSTLTVTVSDEITTAALSGATVQVTSVSGSVTATTNASGIATFNNVTGPVTITAGISGFALTSIVDVNAATVSLVLEPVASNHTISGTISLPDGVPGFDPAGPATTGGIQWQAAVSNSQQPRYSTLRDGQAPFNEPTSGGNSGLSNQVLSFQMRVYDNVAYQLPMMLLGSFTNTGQTQVESVTYEGIVLNQNAATGDVNLGVLNFSTSSFVNSSNVTIRRLSDGTHATITGLPLGSLGNEVISTRVNGIYSGSNAEPLVGLWAFLPFSSAGNAADAYFFIDPSAVGLQLLVAATGNNGVTGASRAASATFDVSDLLKTNPTLPQNLVLPPVPALLSPLPGSVGQGLTPAVQINSNGLFNAASGFYEVLLDQVDGASVRGWRILVNPSTSTFNLPTLPAALQSLAFRQGLGFDSSNQIQLRVSGVQIGATFDFNNADLQVASKGNRKVGRVVIGYAP
jgi:hypothetical protein